MPETIFFAMVDNGPLLASQPMANSVVYLSVEELEYLRLHLKHHKGWWFWFRLFLWVFKLGPAPSNYISCLDHTLIKIQAGEEISDQERLDLNLFKSRIREDEKYPLLSKQVGQFSSPSGTDY